MQSPSEMNALSGALGSVIGYLGAEAAEPVLFDALLWPQRYYSTQTLVGYVVSAIRMPMSGPLHKAALQALDSFRERGLYLGLHAGHMLATAFYADTKLTYKMYGEDLNRNDEDRDVRNCLWVNVYRRLRHFQQPVHPVESKVDVEKKGKQPPTIRRTTQRLQHLHLSYALDKATDDTIIFSETRVPLTAPMAMLLSESTAILSAILVIYLTKCYWFAAYLFLPLLLKFLSIPAAVRREGLADPRTNPVSDKAVLVRVLDYDHGFPLIEGPEALVRQFFRHYAHPRRETRGDRIRELASIALVLVLMLNFPLGLLSMLFVPAEVQTVWLGYQIYVVIIMHLNRITGYEEPGRMERAMASCLAGGKKIRLVPNREGENDEMLGVDLTLSSEEVASIEEGNSRVAALAARFERPVPDLLRSVSETSHEKSAEAGAATE